MISAAERYGHNITIVEIENTSAYNRRCCYCINCKIDKPVQNIVMNTSVYKNIIAQLADISYSRIITFHRYNEPFFEKNEIILERIAFARENIKQATLVASTNGDYLDSDYIKKIVDSGLDELYIQCHYDEFENLGEEAIKKNIMTVNERIGGFRGKFLKQGEAIIFCTINSRFSKLTVEAKNFNKDGFDRAGILRKQGTPIHRAPCFAPLTTMTIDYNGNVNMCCNTVSYVEQHMPFVLGNIEKATLLDIYNAKKSLDLQNALYKGCKPDICSTCNCSYVKFLKKYNIENKLILKKGDESCETK